MFTLTRVNVGADETGSGKLVLVFLFSKEGSPYRSIVTEEPFDPDVKDDVAAMAILCSAYIGKSFETLPIALRACRTMESLQVILDTGRSLH